MKLQAWPFNFMKNKTLTLLFFCDILDIFKNTFFLEQLWWMFPELILLVCLMWISVDVGIFTKHELNQVIQK